MNHEGDTNGWFGCISAFVQVLTESQRERDGGGNRIE